MSVKATHSSVGLLLTVGDTVFCADHILCVRRTGTNSCSLVLVGPTTVGVGVSRDEIVEAMCSAGDT